MIIFVVKLNHVTVFLYCIGMCGHCGVRVDRFAHVHGNTVMPEFADPEMYIPLSIVGDDVYLSERHALLNRLLDAVKQVKLHYCLIIVCTDIK